MITVLPWQLQMTERPVPASLPGGFDVVTAGVRAGVSALESMLSDGHRVGVLLCCVAHQVVHIPVPSGAVDVPLAAARGRISVREQRLWCPGHGLQGCPGRWWMLPPRDGGAGDGLTDFAGLYHALCLTRAA